MIELVLEIRDAADETAIRELVGRRAGITLIGPGSQRLDDRIDVDTLVDEEESSGGGAWYRRQFSIPRGWVVVNEADGIRVLLDEAFITAVDKARAPDTAVFWIATLGESSGYEGDYSRLAAGMDPDAVRDAASGEYYIFEHKLHWYPEFLNAFEVLERHNATGAVPPIQRVGIWARLLWTPGLLRAYDTYRERALAGAYGPQEPPDDKSNP